VFAAEDVVVDLVVTAVAATGHGDRAEHQLLTSF
jgi:hypothetical protein